MQISNPNSPLAKSDFLWVCLIFFFNLLASLLACKILVPQPGIKPVLPALEAWSLNHWTFRGAPVGAFLINF